MTKSELFLQALEEHSGNLHYACKEVGLTRSQVIQFAQNNRVFATKLWEVYEGLLDLAESTLFKIGIDGNHKALLGYLNAKAKNRGFGSSEIIHKEFVPGVKAPEPVDKKLEFKQQVHTMTTEEIEQMVKNIKKVKL